MSKLTWYGHSCFLFEADSGWTCVFDPYAEGSVPGIELPELEADAVYVSHGHADHNAKERIRLRKYGLQNPYVVTTLLTDHDPEGGTLRGKNLITILSGPSETIAHLGDLGRPLKEKEVSKLRSADLIMVPCGGFYTIDAKEARDLIAAVQPKAAVLMHYRKGNIGYDEISAAEEIQKAIPDIQKTDENTIIIGRETGILMMKPVQSGKA